MHKILLIDDDPVVRSLISGILRKKDYEVLLAREGQEGLKLVKDKTPDLVICDYQMPGMSGIDVLDRIRDSSPKLPVIILTAYGDATLTIKSMQTGAFDFIEKPINPRELLTTVKNGLKTVETVRHEQGQVSGDKVDRADVNLMVGKTHEMRDIFKQVGRISQNNVNVVVSGESGSGKERLARLIHLSGYNKDKPIVIVNCKTMAEEQLQGDRRGSAPDRIAVLDEKIGSAGGGTVVLDEVGMLSPPMQMRLLEHISHDQSGLDKQHPRFISTTTQEIHSLVEEGLFIKELYYKLKVFSIHVPPLRKRKEDIPELVRHLLQELNPAFDRKVLRVEEGVIELLQSYNWPGNVRELKNILMQALVLSHNELLEKKHIRIEQTLLEEGGSDSEDHDEEPRSMAEVEKEHIAFVLKYAGWNKQKAASILGITRPTLNAKIEKYQIVNY